MALATMAGCDASAGPGLLIATSWAPAERAGLEADFHRWAASSRIDLDGHPVTLEWLVLAPGDDIEALAQRRRPPDVLLGGRASAFARFAQEEGLRPVSAANRARWCVIERGAPAPAVLVDPRVDARSLEWSMRQLGHGRWREGYAQLVDLAGHEPRISWQADCEPPNRDAAKRPALTEPARPEGVGIVSRARDLGTAQSFLRFLVEMRQARAASRGDAAADAADPDVASLVADLLGAALVDAQDELWAACDALARSGVPAQARKWLIEPPPWPPASVEKYLRHEGENAMSLVETLAGELSPQPALRAWLIRSWLSPPRLVDEALLAEMVHAADGRLVHEPRFRAWLRAEWTAWARQRYRRVAKLAAAPTKSAGGR